jgi:hypothetical protein
MEVSRAYHKERRREYRRRHLHRPSHALGKSPQRVADYFKEMYNPRKERLIDFVTARYATCHAYLVARNWSEDRILATWKLIISDLVQKKKNARKLGKFPTALAKVQKKKLRFMKAQDGIVRPFWV